MKRDLERRPAPDLSVLHAKLRELYLCEYPDGSPHLYERLLKRIPEYIRALVARKLDLLVQDETEEQAQSYCDLSQPDKTALSIFLDPQVLRAHMDVGRDAALSTDRNDIAHFDVLPPIIAHELIMIAAHGKPEQLARMGCVFFDNDGTKTQVDCTSHSRTGRYLERLAEVLCKPPQAIQDWLRERNLTTSAYSVAGDEIIVIVRSEEGAIDKKTLDAFAVEVQKTIATDSELSSFVSFDEPAFVMEYDDWTDEERARYARGDAEMLEKFKVSRGKLRDTFIPSVSFGSATFQRALDEALSPDTKEAKNLAELGVNAFRLMVENADTRLKIDKLIFRETMTDAKWKAFLLRNSENRKLLAELDELRERLSQRESENSALLAEIDEVRVLYQAALKRIAALSGEAQL